MTIESDAAREEIDRIVAERTKEKDAEIERLRADNAKLHSDKAWQVAKELAALSMRERMKVAVKPWLPDAMYRKWAFEASDALPLIEEPKP